MTATETMTAQQILRLNLLILQLQREAKRTLDALTEPTLLIEVIAWADALASTAKEILALEAPFEIQAGTAVMVRDGETYLVSLDTVRASLTVPDSPEGLT